MVFMKIMTKLKARWYQEESYQKTLSYIHNNPGKHPLIVCPTGAGKSFILAMLSSILRGQGNVLILGPTSNIIKQDYKAVVQFVPSSNVGIYSAKLNIKQRRSVTIASINSIHRKAVLFQSYKFIICDESHLIPHSSDGMYRRLFKAVPEATVIGLTATPFRTGTGMLVGTEGALFNDIVFDVPIVRLIKEGYLCSLETKEPSSVMDIEGIKTVAGDYSKKELSEKLDQSGVTEKIINELITLKEQRNKWLVFAIDIQHAIHIADLLAEKGISVGTVHSKQNTADNDVIMSKFKDGEVQALVSVYSLTTGFDDPDIDLIALLRPTKSPVLHIQMIGRGLRISPNKDNCLIMDFAGNIMRLGPINDVHIPIKGKSKGGEAPVKVCLGCQSHVPASAKVCYFCGYTFPPSTTKLTLKAGNLEIIKQEKKLQLGWFPVTSVTYAPYTSMKSINSMRVTYTVTPNKKIHEYINPFSKTKKAYNDLSWLKFRLGYKPYVETVTDMLILAPKLDKPVALKIDFTGNYPRILDATFR